MATSFSSFSIRRSCLAKLASAALDAQHNGQREVCGALVQNSEHLELFPLQNVSEKPGSWDIETTALSILKQDIDNSNKHFAGTYHSHPISDAVPSARDIKAHTPNQLILIYDCCGEEARLWRVSESSNHAVEIPFVISESVA